MNLGHCYWCYALWLALGLSLLLYQKAFIHTCTMHAVYILSLHNVHYWYQDYY